MTIHQYTHLEWDSNFFEFPIAQLSNPTISEPELYATLDHLKADGYVLIYFPTDTPYHFTHPKYTIVPVNSKVTLSLKLSTKENHTNFLNTVISGKNLDKQRITNIALQSAKFSRFFIDTKISSTKASELYAIWIRNSFNPSPSHDILVTEENGIITGICSLSMSHINATIELFAIDELSRGKGYGKKLLNGALAWLNSKGILHCTVVTQGQNSAALHLYESCGFRMDKEEFYYHIWLNND
ncbi:MAG: GNAT family N-acetyltransferase [Fibrobacterales bacterium]